jgi:hypothetical protein
MRKTKNGGFYLLKLLVLPSVTIVITQLSINFPPILVTTCVAWPSGWHESQHVLCDFLPKDLNPHVVVIELQHDDQVGHHETQDGPQNDNQVLKGTLQRDLGGGSKIAQIDRHFDDEPLGRFFKIYRAVLQFIK